MRRTLEWLRGAWGRNRLSRAVDFSRRKRNLAIEKHCVSKKEKEGNILWVNQSIHNLLNLEEPIIEPVRD